MGHVLPGKDIGQPLDATTPASVLGPETLPNVAPETGEEKGQEPPPEQVPAFREVPAGRRRICSVWVDTLTGQVGVEEVATEFDDLRKLCDVTSALHAGVERRLMEALVMHHAPRIAVGELVSESLQDVVLPLVRSEVTAALAEAVRPAGGGGGRIITPGPVPPFRRRAG